MSLEIKPLTSKIVQVTASVQQELSEAFLRFQEHYESPEWKGKIFTVGQFRSWYGETYGGNTYESDWTGFNIPSSVLAPFIKGMFDPLTPSEQEIVRLFRHRSDDFYIIGSLEGSGALEHEICHGLFYTVPEYRKRVMALLNANRKELHDVYDEVRSLMYHPDVLDDEVHAYLSADYAELVEDLDHVPHKLHKSLRTLRDKYFVGV